MCLEFSASVPPVPAGRGCSGLSTQQPTQSGPGLENLSSVAFPLLSAGFGPIWCQFVAPNGRDMTEATDKAPAPPAGTHEF